MPSAAYRIILDTNVVLRGFINSRSASGLLLRACQVRKAVPLLSRPIWIEYRSVLTRPAIVAKYPELGRPEVKDALERLLYLSEYHRQLGGRFSFPRDSKDVPFLELAIAADATHLITTDADMLSLSRGRDDAAKRFRQRCSTLVQTPEDFVVINRSVTAPGTD